MSKLWLPVLVATLALVGCNKTSYVDEHMVGDLCAIQNIQCNDPKNPSCDPADGECKCGGEYHNGVICNLGEECVVDLTVSPPSPSCVSLRCGGPCGPYETCDASDGVCKCNGVACGAGFACFKGVCVDNARCGGVACREGEICDPELGICKCGDGVCTYGETCRANNDGSESYCLGRRCVGMNCIGDTACSPVDGLCHCGSIAGPVCASTQSCTVEAGIDEGMCEGTDICDGVVCSGGTTCSPIDGKCRCGGADNAAPICSSTQTCDQANRRCTGGNACATVQCAAGSNLSCDDEEGICKCGGRDGLVCADGEGCVPSVDLPVPSCVKRCDPLRTDCSGDHATGLTGCYYGAASQIAFCAEPGSARDGEDCTTTTDCVSGYHCTSDGEEGVCRKYCNSNDPGSCPGGTACLSLKNVPETLRGLGVCWTVSP